MGQELGQRLAEYGSSGAYPFHMPGHKRRLGSLPDPYQIDITEIEGFDNLHSPEGILLQLQERAAAWYGAQESYLLVNGSTCGILSAVSAAADQGRGRRLLMARNCHKSAYHAVYLNRLEPVYLWPEPGNGGINGRILSEQVKSALKQTAGVCAVLLTSPTYEGVVSDIEAIARIVHDHDIPLIVDEAHGAHLGLHPALPVSSVRLGADLVIHSLHKTLPALTQTALLHVCGERIDRERLRRFLQIYQTSSPSYVLMASADSCLRLLERRGRELADDLLRHLAALRARTEALERICLFSIDDPTKLLIRDRQGRLSGKEICDILRQDFQLEPEMAAADYALCLTSIGDEEAGFDRLAEALGQLDLRLRQTDASQASRSAAPWDTLRCSLSGSEAVLPLSRAWDAPAEYVPLSESAGRVSASFLCLYPPGTPMLAPGERISLTLIDQMSRLREKGFFVQGIAEDQAGRIRVLRAGETLPEMDFSGDQRKKER